MSEPAYQCENAIPILWPQTARKNFERVHPKTFLFGWGWGSKLLQTDKEKYLTQSVYNHFSRLQPSPTSTFALCSPAAKLGIIFVSLNECRMPPKKLTILSPEKGPFQTEHNLSTINLQGKTVKFSGGIPLIHPFGVHPAALSLLEGL